MKQLQLKQLGAMEPPSLLKRYNPRLQCGLYHIQNNLYKTHPRVVDYGPQDRVKFVLL